MLAREARRIRMRNFQTAKSLANKWTGVFPHVRPETVLVIIGIESHFNPGDANVTDPRAIARGGAWGYMGMTLDTAKSEIPKMPKSLAVIGKFDGSGKSLLDPDLNVAVGTFYLDQLARKFKDFELVVAAYQQGPRHIEDMLTKNMSKEEILASIGPHGKEYVSLALQWKDKIDKGEVV